jgi:hypothetical protein
VCRSNYVRIVWARCVSARAAEWRRGKGVYSAAQSRRHCYALCVCWSSGPDTREHKILCTADAAPLLLSLSPHYTLYNAAYTLQAARERERDLSRRTRAQFLYLARATQKPWRRPHSALPQRPFPLRLLQINKLFSIGMLSTTYFCLSWASFLGSLHVNGTKLYDATTMHYFSIRVCLQRHIDTCIKLRLKCVRENLCA